MSRHLLVSRLSRVAVLAALLVLVVHVPTTEAESTFHVHLGANLPGGDFGSADPGNGGAKFGYAISAEYLVPVTEGGIFWTTLGGVHQNGFDEGAVAFSDSALFYMRDNLGEDELPGFTVRKGSWWTVPLLTGVRAQFGGEDLAYFVSGHLGMAITSSPTLKWTYEDTVDRFAEEEFAWDLSFAFAVGAGLYLNDRFTLSGRAYFMGTPDLPAQREFYATEEQGQIQVGDVIWEETNDWEIEVSMITVQLGVRFD